MKGLTWMHSYLRYYLTISGSNSDNATLCYKVSLNGNLAIMCQNLVYWILCYHGNYNFQVDRDIQFKLNTCTIFGAEISSRYRPKVDRNVVKISRNECNGNHIRNSYAQEIML